VPARNGADDDPLTSQAFSRSALGETDGRSYRVAARRSQAQAMLTEQVETFIQYQSGQSGHTGDYPTASYQPVEQRTGEYRQYRGDAPAAAGQATGAYPAYGSQNGHQSAAHMTQPARAIGAPSGSAASGWPGQPALPAGQYDGQQQRPQAQPRQAAPLPAMPLSAPVPSGNDLGTASSPVAQPGGTAPAKGGLNPYDVAITGSYPYPGQTPAALPGPSQSSQAQSQYGQPQPAQSQYGQPQSAQSQSPYGQPQSGQSQSQYGQPQSGQSQYGVDDPYYRPLPADGYPSGNGDPGSSDPARNGYASYGSNGYQDPRDRRY
jgi:hypothetical protein